MMNIASTQNWVRIPATLSFGQTLRPQFLLFAEIWQGCDSHLVFQNRPKMNTKQAIDMIKLHMQFGDDTCNTFLWTDL